MKRAEINRAGNHHVAHILLRQIAASLATALLLASCSSDQVSFAPPSPPQRPPLQSSLAEQGAMREHQRLLSLFGGEYQAPKVKRLLDDLVARIARVAPQPAISYDITLLNSPLPNAFALPNGRLYVTRGLLALANDTAEAGAVLAHEMSHVIARHASDRAELQLRSALFSKVGTNVLNDSAGEKNLATQSKLTIASFSRQQELEADKIGVGLLAKAKFDPYGAQRFLVSLGRGPVLRGASAGDASKPRGLDMLSSHPSTPERIAQVQSSARQISAPGIGEQDRDTWLNAIDGIAFGDDPAAGVVRGQRYINTSLGVSLEVPSILTLDAGREAVIGVSGDGNLAFRFDVVTLESGQSLTTYMNSRWIDGITVTDVEQLTLNGSPSVTASGKGSDWSFRMAGIQSGQLIYRFILAANSGSTDQSRHFRSIIENFRKIPSSEANGTTTQRLRVVTASANDTSASLAAMMAVQSQSLIQFQALNGFDRNGAVIAGKRYKIISN